jgi:MoaA/NifB/PqqE/SkfB family radical SAM enzyme
MTEIRSSLYWDDFEVRIGETVEAVAAGTTPPVRRVAVFITEGCNFRCTYCNVNQTPRTLTKERFEEVVEQYGDDSIIHITGGEPSIVPWLYPYIEEHGDRYRFHLNTNAYIRPPKNIRRLKVSLDSTDAAYWNDLVGVKAWQRVVDNIKEASKETVTSITYTLTAENYWQAPRFIRFANAEFPDLYAQFFSVYKGDHPRFVFKDDDIDDFFDRVVPEAESVLHMESLALLRETMGNKQRLIAGVRFPDNNLDEPCYISMSERVIGPDGKESACSHLYRDGIKGVSNDKCSKCQYGCNQRLVDFNNIVSEKLNALSV